MSKTWQTPELEAPDLGGAAPAVAGNLAQNLVGNAGVQSMLGFFPGLPVPEIPLPSLPIPELPLPGLPSLPDLDGLLPDLPGPGDLLPQIPGLDDVQRGLGTAGDLWDREGINAILDPVGALDRQQAREELAGRFEIVGDDFVGPPNMNTVTQAEFDRIVETYSNIRLGRGDLTLDASELSETDEADWRQGTMNDIATMMETPSGRQMIMTLSNNPMLDDAGNERQFIGDHDVTGTWLEGLGGGRHHHTTIRPYHQDANGNNRHHDDDAAPLGHDNAVSDDLFPNDGDRSRSASERQADGSRGLGSDPIIRYNPDNMGRLDVDSDGVPNQTTSDIVLMHEMAHSWHQSQGTLATGKVQATDLDLLAVRQGTPITNLPTLGAGHPDLPNPAIGYAGVNRSEHQAAGLGWWGLSTMTENQYRQERAALGETQPDGSAIPFRPDYSTLP